MEVEQLTKSDLMYFLELEEILPLYSRYNSVQVHKNLGRGLRSFIRGIPPFPLLSSNSPLFLQVSYYSSIDICDSNHVNIFKRNTRHYMLRYINCA